MDPDAAQWIAKGDEDLLVVDILVKAKGPTGIACFHCQQAVEKYLKACLSAAGEVPAKTHDLEYLADRLIARGISLAIDRELLAGLRLYAIAPRYPGFGDAEAERDLSRLHQFVRDVRAIVLVQLVTPP